MPANPEVKGGATPYLTVDGALKATEFYKRVWRHGGGQPSARRQGPHHACASLHQ